MMCEASNKIIMSSILANLPEVIHVALPLLGLPSPGDDARLPDNVARPLRRRRQVRHQELHRIGALRRHPLC